MFFFISPIIIQKNFRLRKGTYPDFFQILERKVKREKRREKRKGKNPRDADFDFIVLVSVRINSELIVLNS